LSNDAGKEKKTMNTSLKTVSLVLSRSPLFFLI